MAKLIDGKRISAEIKDELKREAAEWKEKGKEAALAVIQVGNDPKRMWTLSIRRMWVRL